ncbi:MULTISPECIES: heme NO-binding domain-containing protein [Halostella]|uniref:heme NO-binding domain-containing protein n=1 Tax=Halostella TaxID=1843185 RepID=UPI001080EE63|nr:MULTISPECIES: heme NO-binding domain-containing protein [Halostella]
MHGIIHKSLKGFVEDRMTDGAWEVIMDESGIEPKLYLPVSHYPDEELDAIFDTIADRTDQTEASLQRTFGEHLAPALLDTFKAHVRDDWTTLDLLSNLETIYEQIRTGNDETDPPAVDTERVDEETVTVTYRSDREMCPLAKGIVLGIAGEYDETVTIEEDACLLDGDDRCDLTVVRE